MRLAVWHFALTGALVFSTLAVAQESRPAPQGVFPGAQQKQNLPVQIDAKALEVQDKKKTATFTGNVKVVQGDTTMTCRTLVVFYGQELGLAAGGDAPVVKANSTAGAVPNAQNIRRIEAHGDVLVVSKDQTATGDLGVYDLPAKTITLTGNVVLNQGKNVIHGDRLIVDTVTGNAHVEGAQRTGVRAVIVPNKDHNGAESNTMTIGPGQTAPGGSPR